MKIGNQINVFFLIMTLSLLCVFSVGSFNYLQASTMPTYSRLNPISTIVTAPTDVALDSSENIYVVESSNNRLLIYSQSGQYKRSLTTGLNKPISVAVDGTGRIFIANKTLGNVAVYYPDLSFFRKLGSGDGEFSQPNDIAIDSAGNIYVADYNQDKIKVYFPDGTYNYSYGTTGSGNGEFNYPCSIVLDEDAGEILVLDHKLTVLPTGTVKGGRVQVFDMNWGFIRSFGQYGDLEGQMNKPQGVEVDDEGRIYVTEAQYHVVYVYDPVGNYLGKITDTVNPMRTPLGIARGSSDRLFIASLNTRKVEIYGLDAYTNMGVTPLTLTFSGQRYGSNPPLQNVQISNNGAVILDWTASTDDNWILLSDSSGSLDISDNFALNVGVDLSGLSEGTYQGTATISSGSGAAETVAVNLTVLSNPPVANAGGPYSSIEGEPITLDGSGSGGSLVLYEWDIDNDGTFDYSSSSPVQPHTYSIQGNYNIRLRVTDLGGATDESITAAYISDSIPSVDFTGSPTYGTSPLTVNFTNNSSGYDQPLSYEWDFDNDGTIDSTAVNPSHQYPDAGTYTVTLTVLDADGSINSVSKNNYITVSSFNTLNIYMTGSGSGTVASVPAGIDCGTDCSETYNYGEIIKLSAIPNAGSVFTGWTSGGCNGTGDCVVAMDSSINVTAAFDVCSNLPVRIGSVSPTYYPSLQSAYNASFSGDIILSQHARYTEDLNFSLDKSISIIGGYSCDYLTTSGKTRIKGDLTVTDGTVAPEYLILE